MRVDEFFESIMNWLEKSSCMDSSISGTPRPFRVPSNHGIVARFVVTDLPEIEKSMIVIRTDFNIKAPFFVKFPVVPDIFENVIHDHERS